MAEIILLLSVFNWRKEDSLSTFFLLDLSSALSSSLWDGKLPLKSSNPLIKVLLQVGFVCLINCSVKFSPLLVEIIQLVSHPCVAGC